MQLFLKYTGEFLRTYPQIRLNSNDETLIRNECMKHLGLSNMGQLRDRYEGQSFFDKTLKNIGSVIAVQRHLKIPLIDVNKIKIGGYEPKLKLNGQIVDIIVFDFGTLPLVNIDNIRNPICFIIQKDRVTFSLCGIGNIHIVKQNLVKSSVEKSTYINYMNFTGFKDLVKIEKF